MYDVIIVGKGPAGISAALYTQRANLKTLVVATGYGALEDAKKIDNYYGFPGGISGRELAQNGEAQARELGVELAEAQVTGLMPAGDQVLVQSTTGEFSCKAVILATGKAKLRPERPDVRRFEGKGVSYCAVCDGFFYRGKEVAVLGDGDYAASEAAELTHFAQVTILTNGKPFEGALPAGAKLDTRELEGLYGEETLAGVKFRDGSTLPLSGLFVAIGTASAAALARKTGLETEGDAILTGPEGSTNIPGIFSAGDCTGGFLQVSKAVSDGALAAKGAISYVRKLKS